MPSSGLQQMYCSNARQKLNDSCCYWMQSHLMETLVGKMDEHQGLVEKSRILENQANSYYVFFKVNIYDIFICIP